MFPLNSNLPYIKDNGTRDKLGNVIGSGGALPEHSAADSGKVLTVTEEGALEWDNTSAPYTPDYVNDRLVIGVHGNFNYYVPMSKEYVGDHLEGYEIKTVDSSGYSATIEVYKIIVVDGAVVHSEKLQTIVYNSGAGYDDENINVVYDSKWKATLKVTMKNVSNDETVVSPVQWVYSETVDYKWYIPE